MHPRGISKSYANASDINENSHESCVPGVLSEECRVELGLSEEDVKEKGKALEEVVAEVKSLIGGSQGVFECFLNLICDCFEFYQLDTFIRKHVSSSSEHESEESQDNSSELSFAFVTEGQLPLRQCVHPEASTKDIKLPEYYYSFFDLKKEFCGCYVGEGAGVEDVNGMVKCEWNFFEFF